MFFEFTQHKKWRICLEKCWQCLYMMLGNVFETVWENVRCFTLFAGHFTFLYLQTCVGLLYLHLDDVRILEIWNIQDMIVNISRNPEKIEIPEHDSRLFLILEKFKNDELFLGASSRHEHNVIKDIPFKTIMSLSCLRNVWTTQANPWISLDKPETNPTAPLTQTWFVGRFGEVFGRFLESFWMIFLSMLGGCLKGVGKLWGGFGRGKTDNSPLPQNKTNFFKGEL